MGRSTNQVTPDFLVDSNDDGTVTFALNHGNLPELRVSAQYEEMARAYKDNKASMNRREKEALLYAREKVERAQGYIEAVKQRRHTLFVTMKAIIAIQHRFFVDGDEADLRPMTLKDIGEWFVLVLLIYERLERHLDVAGGEFFSAIGRVAFGKEEAQWERAPTRLGILKGMPIARRTVAKYREQLGLPVARLRKE